MTNLCPSCGKPLVKVERQGAPYLILEGYPDEKALVAGSSEMWSTVMQEIARAGGNTYAYCKSSVWLHPKGPNKTKLEKDVFKGCERHMMEALLELVKKKTGVLLVGADATKLVTGLKVSEWSGLNVQPLLFSAPVVICMEKPGTTIGEVRLAVTRFVNQVKPLIPF